MLKEFKEFAIKRQHDDMAVGIIIGGAFNSLVSTLVNDVIMPLLSVLTGEKIVFPIFSSLWTANTMTLCLQCPRALPPSTSACSSPA